MPKNIVIANTVIHQDLTGRYCLNDLHRASGEEKRHGASYWLTNQQTQELIAELETTVIPVVTEVGRNGGTFVCKELVYAYAMWISAKFHLEVIRTFDALVNAAPVAPALALPADYIQALESLLASKKAEVLAIEQRDHAIATKAQIGDKKVATAMATASKFSREATKLRDQLGFNTRHATVIAVEGASGKKFGKQDWRPLKAWCKGNASSSVTVPCARYGKAQAWPAGAWGAVYGVDLVELFGEVVA